MRSDARFTKSSSGSLKTDGQTNRDEKSARWRAQTHFLRFHVVADWRGDRIRQTVARHTDYEIRQIPALSDREKIVIGNRKGLEADLTGGGRRICRIFFSPLAKISITNSTPPDGLGRGVIEQNRQ